MTEECEEGKVCFLAQQETTKDLEDQDVMESFSKTESGEPQARKRRLRSATNCQVRGRIWGRMTPMLWIAAHLFCLVSSIRGLDTCKSSDFDIHGIFGDSKHITTQFTARLASDLISLSQKTVFIFI